MLKRVLLALVVVFTAAPLFAQGQVRGRPVRLPNAATITTPAGCSSGSPPVNAPTPNIPGSLAVCRDTMFQWDGMAWNEFGTGGAGFDPTQAIAFSGSPNTHSGTELFSGQVTLNRSDTEYFLWADDPAQADFGLLRIRNKDDQASPAGYRPGGPCVKYEPPTAGRDVDCFERWAFKWDVTDPSNPVIQLGSEWGSTLSVTSLTRSGSTATLTVTSNYRTGDVVTIAGADQTEYNIAATLTKTGANTYTYTVSGTPDSPATGTITATGGAPQPVALLASQLRHGPALTEAAGNIAIFDSAALMNSYAGLLLLGPEPAYADGNHYSSNLMQFSLGANPGLVQVRGNGTFAAPTKTLNGDALGAVEFDGLTLDTGQLTTTGGAAYIVAYARGDYDDISDTPAQMMLFASPSGELDINPDGSVTIPGLAGTGTQFVCAGADGKLVRSATACGS